MVTNRLNDQYQERVLPSIAVYLALFVIPASLFLVFLPFGENLALLCTVGSALILLIISFVTAPKIYLDEQRLTVGKATIERIHLGFAKEIPRAKAFEERGRNLNPKAFAKFQAGVKELVLVEVIDDSDPTPYWIFSTRNAEVLAARLNQN